MRNRLLESLFDDLSARIDLAEFSPKAYYTLPPAHLPFDFVLVLPGISASTLGDPTKSEWVRIAEESPSIAQAELSGDRLNLCLTDKMLLLECEKDVNEFTEFPALDAYSPIQFPPEHILPMKTETMIKRVYMLLYHLSMRHSEYPDLTLPDAIPASERQLICRTMLLFHTPLTREVNKALLALEAFAHDFKQWFAEIPILSQNGHPGFRVRLANTCRKAVERISSELI